jgi:UDP-2-acetamido-2,6-beta-L-arabino-hexul-4-ose reductase
MLKIGITGQAGFVGKHLYNTLNLFQEEFERVDFKKDFFDEEQKLNEFVSKCDVIVHLAAMNRHNDPQVIYDINVGLAQKLVKSLEATSSKAHVIFSSSTQEERDNLYGKSKKEARQLLANWAKTSEGNFTGLIIPNVFGPFGHPNYNSVVATFSHKIARNETPTIDVDGDLKLIYVGELVDEILKEIRSRESKEEVFVPHTSESKVSKIRAL